MDNKEMPEHEIFTISEKSLMCYGWNISAGRGIRMGSPDTDDLIAVTFKGHRRNHPEEEMMQDMCIKLEWFVDFINSSQEIIDRYKRVMGL